MQFLPGFSSFNCSPHALLECSLSVSSCHDVRIPTHMECDTSWQSRLSIVFNSDQPPDMCMKKPPDNSNPPAMSSFPSWGPRHFGAEKSHCPIGRQLSMSLSHFCMSCKEKHRLPLFQTIFYQRRKRLYLPLNQRADLLTALENTEWPVL